MATLNGPLPVDVIAASVCWLARFQGLRTAGPGVVAATSYWHPARCRFCSRPLDALLEPRLEDCDPEAVKAFHNLPPSVRAARVREAQEVPWWEIATSRE